jgi:hypothetical protein
MRKMIVAGLLASFVVTAHAAGVQVPRGRITGNTYQQFSAPQKQSYVIGVVDGLFASPVMAMTDVPRALRLVTCVNNAQMTDAQIQAIVDKFMTNNPERWGEGMGSLVYGAMREACAKENTPLD